MKLKKRGKHTSKVELLNISPFGIWIFVGEREYFLPYDDYPWFRNASVSTVQDVKLVHDNHLYWPNLDIDLEINALDHPDKYSLIYA